MFETLDYYKSIKALLEKDFQTFKLAARLKPELMKKVLRQMYQLPEFKDVSLLAAESLGYIKKSNVDASLQKT